METLCNKKYNSGKLNSITEKGEQLNLNCKLIYKLQSELFYKIPYKKFLIKSFKKVIKIGANSFRLKLIKIR